MKNQTWAERLLNKIFEMSEQEIHIGCTSCLYGVHDYWEDFKSEDKNGEMITGKRRARHWQKIILPESDVPEVGQPLNARCPNEKCEERSLVRIKKQTQNTNNYESEIKSNRVSHANPN